MSRARSAALALAACIVFTVSAQAADNTRYVSITGKNTNPCTLAQPCKTLQRGISQTPVGGEVRILDSGFYGNNANIKKSLAITGNGNTIYLGNPITINKASAVVTLRGLTLNGQGSIENGVVVLAASAVHIERSTVAGFTAEGIIVSNANVKLFVSDSVSRENGGSGLCFCPPAPGAGKMTVDGSRFENNGGSGLLTNGIESTVTRSIGSGNASVGFMQLIGGRMNVSWTAAANNGTNGFRAVQGDMTIESSVARGNDVGVYSHIAADVVVLSNSVITNNVTGVRNGGGMLTRQNNVLEGNDTPVVGNMPGVAAAF